MAVELRPRTREEFVEIIRALGQDLVDRADEIVGSVDYMTDFDIWLRFPADSFPTIDVSTSYVSKNYTFPNKSN